MWQAVRLPRRFDVEAMPRAADEQRSRVLGSPLFEAHSSRLVRPRYFGTVTVVLFDVEWPEASEHVAVIV